MTRAIPWAAALASALGFVAVVLLGASPVTRADFPLDDAWIHLDYARGLLRDGLPTYNPGVPEAGFSSPLWLVCVSVGSLLSRGARLPIVLVTKVLSAVFGGIAAAGLAKVAARAGASPPVALGLALTAPLGPWWCAAAASGMEVTLTAAMLSLALASALDDRPRRAGVWLALATLARPECAAAALAMTLVHALRPAGAGLRVAIATILPTVLAASAWVAYDLAVTGLPLPNAFYVKAGTPDLGHALAFAWNTLAEDGVVVGLLLVGLAAWGLRSMPSRSSVVWVALAVIPAVGVLASRPLDPAVLLYHRRYLYPFLVLLWWPAALGAQRLVDLVRRHVPTRPRWLAAMAVLLAVVTVGSSVLGARTLHAAQCQDIATFHTEPARAIAAHTPADAVVAVEGAGAMRYFGERAVVDLVGLNEHELIRHPRGTIAHLCHLLRVRRPGWFVLPASWVPRFAPAWTFTWHGAIRSNRYAQLEPPRRHEVVLLSAVPRPEALARCGIVSAPSVAAPAPPSAP